MPYGFVGKLLEIDLSSERIREIELREELLRKFIGGRGLGSWLLWNRLGERWENLDPLSPENQLMFLTGPMTGYYPGARICVTGKSPLSNGIVGSTIGTELGIELKASGYDGLIVTGKASSPVYIFVNDDKSEIRDASKHWGKGGREILRDLIRETWGELKSRNRLKGIPKEPSILYIGPAGENLVRFAAVISKWTHAAGYGGYGAVMGSKNLKAVVVKGSGPLPDIADPKRFQELLSKVRETLLQNTYFRMWGTGHGGYAVGAITSSEPVRNWQEEWHDKKEYSQPYFESRVWVKRFWSDYGCPTSCLKVSLLVKDGEVAITDCPDYELQAYLGTNLGIFDPECSVYLSYLADELGFDGINLGKVLGFAAELYQRGIIKEEELGFRLSWGDCDSFAKLMRLIAERKGIASILAEGTFRAMKKLSELKKIDLSKYAVQTKGIGLGAHGIRSRKDYPSVIGYAVSVQGGDHTSVHSPYPQYSEDWFVFYDSAVICSFNSYALAGEFLIDFLNAVTGWNVTIEEWHNVIKKRILSIQRILLLLGGPDWRWDPRRDDDQPPRFYEPLPSGPYKGAKIYREEVEAEKKKYYRRMGWNEHGIPKREELERLGLRGLVPAVNKIKTRLGLIS